VVLKHSDKFLFALQYGKYELNFGVYKVLESIMVNFCMQLCSLTAVRNLKLNPTDTSHSTETATITGSKQMKTVGVF
jgi:ABC-type uncharacterized transport system permease subunit